METFERDTLTKRECRQKALDYAETIFEGKVDPLAVVEIMKDLKQFQDFTEILDRALFTAIDYGLATWGKDNAARLEIDTMEDNLLVACKSFNC